MAVTPLTVADGLTSVTLADWNFDKRIVEPEKRPGTGEGLDSSRFASGKAFIIASGPSTFNDVTASNVTPIGLVQDMNLQQERQMSELYELGSRAPYYMVGRSSRRLSLSSIVYSGANLLRAVHQNAGLEFPGSGGAEGQRPEQKPAGAENDPFFSNLDSRFFEGSTGLYLRLASLADARYRVEEGDLSASSNNQIAGMYLEECYVRAYGLSVNANNTVVSENTVITFARVVPIERQGGLSAVASIRTAGSA